VSTTGKADERKPSNREAGTARARILDAAWAMVESGRLGELTMAGVGSAAGVSRQTVYVQFGTRAGLLVDLVRERDEANPRGERVAAALALPNPVDALVELTRELSGWWREIHPVARALHAAALNDEAARAAWEDRMRHLHAFTTTVVQRLDEAGVLAREWDAPRASEWLATQLNPLNWVMLVEDSGWAQGLYEERMATIAQQVLVEPAKTRPPRDRTS
jgi:AcrR family transcriptional regulator